MSGIDPYKRKLNHPLPRRKPREGYGIVHQQRLVVLRDGGGVAAHLHDGGIMANA